MRYASITDRLRGLGSGKWAVHFEARRRAEAGDAIIELTIGEPDIPPEDDLLDVCSAAMHAGRTGYGIGGGADPELAEAIAAKYSRRTGRTITPANVLAFPGTQTALYASMMGIAEYGDEVLVGDPLYATYQGVIHAVGATMRTVPLRAENGFHMRAEDLDRRVTDKSRVVLLNSPHNPTGAVLTRGELEAIGEVCKRHDLWIICDEVYEELIFNGEFVSPLDLPDLAERAIAVSSISKSHAAPGFRSGWAVGPVEFCERLLPVSETMLFGNQPFIADMTTYALTEPSPTAATLRETYMRRANVVAKALKGSGLEPLMPDAGMFILVDVSAMGIDGEAFAWRALDEGVAVMPGGSFGQQAKDFVRISLTVPDEDLETACARMAAMARTKENVRQIA
ncbi:pyridoxal phosphate-dependent aminotransferase [Acuticoccus sediminis]|uniref:pyridoxal phosphate-dependent aminotransferase n=1 Tax=Acuticoccus sediminis TaxID=2184697 RepID=UPI001CFCF6CF|nr:pyridoxal phosphate-dependent aminotransferase [Acuticoccus sediminis]